MVMLELPALYIFISPELAIYLLVSFLFIAIGIVYWAWRYLYGKKWTSIEMLNARCNINRNNAYIDKKGYLRWKVGDRLCHREIAWNAGIRGKGNFGNSDIHHKDRNKLNCNPENLECLTRDEHQEEHGNIIYVDGKRYVKLCHTSKVYRETDKAIMVARRWIPKSQMIVREGHVYIADWIYKERFG